MIIQQSFLLLLVATTSAFIFDKPPKAEINPENPYFVLNESLRLNCSINRADVLVQDLIASDLKFSLNDDLLSTNQTIVFNDDIIGIERPVQLSDEGTVICCEHDCTSYNTFLATQHIQVEYAVLQNVTDFKCITKNWDESLTCSWSIGEYRHLQHIKVHITVSNGLVIVPCPHTMDDNSCTWQNSDIDLMPVVWIFNLTVSNSVRGVTRSFTRTVYDTDSIVKPNPVNADFVKGVNTTCICLELPTRPGKEITSFIQVHSKWNGTLNYTVEKEQDKCIYDLVPATDYSVTLSVRPYSGEYYSDPVTMATVTEADVPAVAPSTFLGGYDSTDCTESLSRNVTIYWKSIPEILQNGNIIRYVIRYKEEGKDEEKIVDATVNSKKLDLKCNVEYTVDIYGENSVGLSPQATLTIQRANDLYLPTELIVETYRALDQDAIDISWSIPEGQAESLKTFTVYWCSHISQICVTEVEGVTVPGDRRSFTLTQDKSSNMDTLKIGVSMEKSQYSSGINWATCKYNKDAEPATPTPKIMENSPDNALTLQWFVNQPCDNTAPYIVSYSITWCQVNNNENCQGLERSLIIESSKVPIDYRYTIPDLETSTRYGITVQALSATRKSPKSEMVFGVPTNNDLSEGTIAGIVIGAIFGFVLCLAGIFCIFRICSSKIKSYNKGVPIDVPTFKGIEFTENADSKYSKSSNGVVSPLMDDVSSGETDEDTIKRNGGPEKTQLQIQRQFSEDSGRGSLTSDHVLTPQPGDKSGLTPIDEVNSKNDCENKPSQNPDYVRATQVNYVLYDQGGQRKSEDSSRQAMTQGGYLKEDGDKSKGKEDKEVNYDPSYVQGDILECHQGGPSPGYVANGMCAYDSNGVDSTGGISDTSKDLLSATEDDKLRKCTESDQNEFGYV